MESIQGFTVMNTVLQPINRTQKKADNHTAQMKNRTAVKMINQTPTLNVQMINHADAGVKRWQRLTNELNVICAASKDAAGWKQTWSDMKLRIKKLAASLTNLPTGNAGKPPRKLKPEEELVYHLCGGKDFIGAGTEEELGVALVRRFIFCHFNRSIIANYR
ncbi:uncharacterized protein [Bemisia tabaci]|uniref:uncharacterized protein n=1 Tax=Bemisia tabaci TaxID=7038 RepID=UPI003B288021